MGQTIGGTCGFEMKPKQSQMWVRAMPELSPKEVPGMGEDLLEKMSAQGGSLEEKIQCLVETFRCSARHLESMQTLLRRRAVDKRVEAGYKDDLPSEVKAVIADGTYQEDFLKAFDEKSFPLYGEEIVPGHEYRLALEVHTGGAYWSGITAQDAASSPAQKVETVTASSPAEGSSSIIAQFGAAQRGAVFVWRWHYLPDRGPYNLPAWLTKVLAAEGVDPLRKLSCELEAIRRWEQQVRQETAQHVKTGKEMKDPYIREVLRLWPTETDAQGFDQLKKVAWVEGLDHKLFTGRTVPVTRVQYDDMHFIALSALIAKRHNEDAAPQENSPPYKLTTTWQWVPPESPQKIVTSSAVLSSAVSLQQAPILPSTRGQLPSRQELKADQELIAENAMPMTPKTVGGSAAGERRLPGKSTEFSSTAAASPGTVEPGT